MEVWLRLKGLYSINTVCTSLSVQIMTGGVARAQLRGATGGGLMRGSFTLHVTPTVRLK